LIIPAPVLAEASVKYDRYGYSFSIALRNLVFPKPGGPNRMWTGSSLSMAFCKAHFVSSCPVISENSSQRSLSISLFDYKAEVQKIMALVS
jgi:hypothetical protein